MNKIEIKTILKNYFINDKKMSESRAEAACEKLLSHLDIASEFAEYCITGKFSENPLKIKAYTAEQLYNTTCLTVMGAYNYLVFLRENPEDALYQLKQGLPNYDSGKTSSKK